MMVPGIVYICLAGVAILAGIGISFGQKLVGAILLIAALLYFDTSVKGGE